MSQELAVAVVGLGNLGLAIARRLLGRGVEVVGVDQDPLRRDAWRAASRQEALPSADDVDWAQQDAAFVVVRLVDQAAQVLDVMADRRSEAACYVVTTLDPSFARGLDAYAERGLDVIELPVSGGEVGVLKGDLTVMAAGALNDERRRFLRSTIAAHLVELEAFGEPTFVKLINNVVSAYNAQALVDMLGVAEGAGIDPAKMYEVLKTATGGSWVTENFPELIYDLLEKDVELLRSTVGDLPTVDLDTGLTERLSAGRSQLARWGGSG